MKYDSLTSAALSECEEIFRIYYLSLINYACKFVLRKTIAEDIVQEMFMTIWMNRESIHINRETIKPYLYKAVRNRCLNYISLLKNTLSLDEEGIDFLIQKEVFEMPDENLSLEDVERELRYCIESLPPQCRKVFVYSRHHKLKNSEIAAILEISEKAVEKHITKALKIIREGLQKKGLLSYLILVIVGC